MKTLIVIAVGLLISLNVSAKSRETVHRDTMLMTEVFDSKSAALDAGFNVYESLETASDRQLRRKLNTFSDNVAGGISIDSAKVRIEEFPVSRNNIQYRAVIDVNYHYDATGDTDRN